MPRKICGHPGCRKPARITLCPDHEKLTEQRRLEASRRNAASKRQSGSADKYERFYRTSQWASLRNKKMKQSPLCEHCAKNNIVKAAMDIDHIVEIRDEGGWDLRLDYMNLQSLCRSCHQAKSARARRFRNKK